MNKYKIKVHNQDSILPIDYIVSASDINSARVVAVRNEIKKLGLNPTPSNNCDDTLNFAHNKGIWVYQSIDLQTGRTL
jgi:16S rRNA C967 or C1407 C5-methylase (RsmB/RsmF family)